MSTPGWESVKENAAPLQRGRNVSALERVAATTASCSSGSSSGSGVLQLQKDDSQERIREFERLVRPSEAPHATEAPDGDDPLVHWMTYIKFFQETFPSDTHQQFLLMERCTRALVKMPQYANDDRFISVCAKYADKTKEPSQVFKYLYQQKVGQQTALFWVAWAYVAEKDNDFPFAEQIYKKGISRDAQPMNVLKVRHKQFQRRMSRHWLNSSQRNEQLEEDYDEEEQPSASRGALGGLSHDRVRRNDRAAASGSFAGPRSRLPASRRPVSNPRANSNSNNLGAANSGFSVFVENEGENAPNGMSYLDQPVVEHKRVIERDADRRKENTLNAERWNERGGLPPSTTTAGGSHSSSSAGGYLTRPGHTRSSSSSGGGGAPPPFAVFVDEECVAQHEKEEAERKNQIERHRSVRDERTFRNRSEEGMAERLARDPLRYVRDHTQFEADLAVGREQEEEGRRKSQADEAVQATGNNDGKRSRVGFNKRLLKGFDGVEQSFEEARARANCYKLAPTSVNFNLMQVNKADQTSQMDLDDEEVSTDVSLSGTSVPSEQVSPNHEQPRKIQRREPQSEGRVLFQSEPSFETSLNQTAVSAASSAINEADAVGVPTRKEEETINTKLAMRELSMMFSSPAFGVDEGVRRMERSTARINESHGDEESRGVDASFANVGDAIGTSMLDNSIVNYEDDLAENRGPRNPLARSMNTPGVEKMALRELQHTSDADSRLSCSRQRTVIEAHERPQRDPLRGPEVEIADNPGFQIFEDDDQQQDGRMPMQSGTFSIFQDDAEEDNQDSRMPLSEAPRAQGFQIFEDAKDDENEDDRKPAAAEGVGFTIHEDSCEDTESDPSDPYAQGDTATFSLLGDAVGQGDDESKSPSRMQSSPEVRDGQGDTASLTLFNEIFQTQVETNDEVRARSNKTKPSEGFSIFVDDDEASELSTPQSQRGEKRKSTDNSGEKAVDYNSAHSHSSKMALRRIQASSSVASDSRSPLLSLLSVHGKSFHLPHIPLPREFRAKHLSGNTKVQIGKHAGVVSRELGRGAYGVVALMDLGQGGLHNYTKTIAVKAQSPTDCLAWECDILRRLEERTKSNSEVYAFPSPLSFISLADGGIFSMTAGSKTGLNLVDLANVYKVKLGEHVPEIVVLHYVSRMLRHIEQLHWHGKILHCDVKPDNFVLTTLDCQDNACRDIEASDVMLVDFGRAMDLEEHCEDGADARSVMFCGDACEDDMKCVAMRAGKSWSYDVDTFGVLACAHVLLYGTHITLRKGKKDRWYLGSALKRYWQRDLWTNIFETLLNLDEQTGAAIGSRPRSLRSLREEIDSYTATESEKLRSFLNRQVTLLPSSRDQLK